MKVTILEVFNEITFVQDKKRNIIEIPRRPWHIPGTEIDINKPGEQKKKKKRMRSPLIVILCIVLMSVLTICYMLPSYRVIIELNPYVMMDVNLFNRVIYYESFNKAVKENLKEHNFKFLSLDQGIKNSIESILINSEVNLNATVIAVVITDSQERKKEVKDIVKNSISKFPELKPIVYDASNSRINKIIEKGYTPGKYLYLDGLNLSGANIPLKAINILSPNEMTILSNIMRNINLIETSRASVSVEVNKEMANKSDDYYKRIFEIVDPFEESIQQAKKMLGNVEILIDEYNNVLNDKIINEEKKGIIINKREFISEQHKIIKNKLNKMDESVYLLYERAKIPQSKIEKYKSEINTDKNNKVEEYTSIEDTNKSAGNKEFEDTNPMLKGKEDEFKKAYDQMEEKRQKIDDMIQEKQNFIDKLLEEKNKIIENIKSNIPNNK